MYEYQTSDPLLYPLLKEFAQKNRANPTEAEEKLWHNIKGGNLGVKFNRQHIIGEFIADFVCIEKGLVIEIDGGYHTLPDMVISDEDRTRWLNAHGFDVLRFTNDEVISDIYGVLERIENYIEQH